MFKNLEVMRMAQAMATHAGQRQSVVAQNVAHANTPGYRARDLPDFSDIFQSSGVDLRRTRAGHWAASNADNAHLIDAPNNQKPNGNTVSIESQMVKAGEIRHQHDLALAIYKASLDILRLSVGRR